METLPKDLLIVFRFAEFEQYSGGSFRQTKTAFKVEFVANVGCLVQGEFVGGCQ